MDIKRNPGKGTNGAYDIRADCDVRDEVTVHNIDMHPIRSCPLNTDQFLTEFCKIS